MQWEPPKRKLWGVKSLRLSTEIAVYLGSVLYGYNGSL